MQNPFVEGTTWVVAHVEGKAFFGRRELPILVGPFHLMGLKDAVELKNITIPRPAPNGQIAVTHESMFAPIGYALEPTTIHIKPSALQYLEDMDPATQNVYKAQYESLLKDLRSAHANRAGITLVQ